MRAQGRENWRGDASAERAVLALLEAPISRALPPHSPFFRLNSLPLPAASLCTGLQAPQHSGAATNMATAMKATVHKHVQGSAAAAPRPRAMRAARLNKLVCKAEVKAIEAGEQFLFSECAAAVALRRSACR